MENLSDKIKNKTAKVSIIGLGYVGLPLSIEFCKSGFTVIGIDVDKSKVDALKKGESYVQDVKDDDVKLFIKNKKFIPTTHFSLLKDADTVSICVPTPLRKTRDPDISYIVSAASEIKKYLHKGQLIVLESTTYPGTTDEVLLPELESTGDPDISYIVSAASEIKKYLHKGQLIVLESTTYPGTTDEVLLPELESTGL